MPQHATILSADAIRGDDPGRAAEMVEELLLSKDPTAGLGGAYDLLGQVYLEAGDLGSARDAFERDLQIYPESPGTFLYMGLIEEVSGNPVNSSNWYAKAPAREIEPSYVEKVRSACAGWRVATAGSQSRIQLLEQGVRPPRLPSSGLGRSEGRAEVAQASVPAATALPAGAAGKPRPTPVRTAEPRPRDQRPLPEAASKDLAAAADLLEHPKGMWLVWLSLALGLLLWPATGSGWMVVVGPILGLIVAAAISGVLQRYGTWGVKGLLSRASRRAGLPRKAMFPFLPGHLKDSPDTLEWVDRDAFEKLMADRKESTAQRLAAAHFDAPEERIKEISARISAEQHEEARMALEGLELAPEDGSFIVVAVVVQILEAQRAQLISARLKRAGDLMLNHIGSGVDTGTLLKACIDEAGRQMAPQFVAFGLVFRLLAGMLKPQLRLWPWEDAIDVLLHWSNRLNTGSALAAYVETHLERSDGEHPVVLADRVLCWVYGDPAKWEVVQRMLDYGSFSLAAVAKDADHREERERWKKLAAEIKRIAAILKERPGHESGAESALPLCDAFLK